MKTLKIYALIPLFISIAVINCTDPDEKNENITNESVINPPLLNINIPYSSYSVNPQEDTILELTAGSKIIIPKNAFLDSEGKVVNTEVEIEYREFSNVFDIYTGGIPMQYDSAGTSLVFETAGMLEINAKSNNKPVFVNPNNRIEVQMNSFQKGNEYNIYQLDTVTGKWTNIGKDKIVEKNHDDEIAKLPKVPKTPIKAGQFSFSIGDDTGEYPELAMYENVLFESIDGKSCGFTSTGIKIKNLNNGKYEVNFILEYNGKLVKEEKCICYLAFKEGVDYDNAMKAYQNKYASLIDKRGKMKKRIELEWDSYLKIKKKYADAGMLDFFYKEEVKSLKGANKIERTLAINKFGYINIDKPSNYPQGAKLLAKFEDKVGSKIKLSNIVLIEKGRNALFRYKDTVRFNPLNENILWGTTENGKLAYFNAGDFKSVDSTSGSYTFHMKIHKKELKSYDDIIGVLLK